MPAVEKRMVLRGANRLAYKSNAPDLLVCGAAGTGKSVALMIKMLDFAAKHAGTRCLFARKTRESLTESGLVTFERDILGLDNPLLTHRPNLRKVRQAYRLPNGSEIIVCGLDKPEKALSADYDFIFCQEATEIELADYETLSGRLRTGVAGYEQFVMDCNPTTPAHWLYQRFLAGKLQIFNSRHCDNPRFYDSHAPGRTNIGTAERPNWIAGHWTADGIRYIETRLKNLTGARRKRFFEGIWAAAEGLVYDGYDPAVHLKPAGWRPPHDWITFWSIDWGFTAPLSLQMWAVDPDGRMYLFRELYRTKWRVEEVAKYCRQILDSGEEKVPMAIVADHDPEAQATWRTHAQLPIENAWKEDKYEGIEHSQSRFDVQSDGKPLIFFVPNSLSHPRDESLSGEGKPASTLEELGGYIWDQPKPGRPAKELPVKLNDHAMDSMRYAIGWARRFLPDSDPKRYYTGTVDESHFGDIRNTQF